MNATEITELAEVIKSWDDLEHSHALASDCMVAFGWEPDNAVRLDWIVKALGDEPIESIGGATVALDTLWHQEFMLFGTMRSRHYSPWMKCHPTEAWVRAHAQDAIKVEHPNAGRALIAAALLEIARVKEPTT